MPTIIPATPADAPDLARRLLAAAGDRPERVRTVTHGGGTAFDVDDDLAAAISAPEPEPEPKKTTRTTKTKAPTAGA